MRSGGPPPSLNELVAAVSPELAAAVAVALRIDPRQRYPTASEMGRALEEASRGIAPGSGTAIVPPAGPNATTALLGRSGAPSPDERTRVAGVTPRQPRSGQPRPQPQPEPQSSPVRARRIAAALVAAAIIIVVVVVIVLSVQSNGTVQLQNPPGFSNHFADALQQLTNLLNSNTS